MSNLTDHKIDTKSIHLPTNGWGKLWITLSIISLLTLSAPGCFMAVFFFICYGGTVKDNPNYVSPKKDRKKWEAPKEPYWYNPRTPKDGIVGRRDTSWAREELVDNEDLMPKVVEEKTLAITNHARRNLALRHGIITELTHLDYEELTPFEEEGEGCYIALFSQINKSKEFAVFLDEDKTVIKTFMPHTEYNRNRAYFKKHTNLDNALKDDMTKDLEFLQKVWLDKIA